MNRLEKAITGGMMLAAAGTANAQESGGAQKLDPQSPQAMQMDTALGQKMRECFSNGLFIRKDVLATLVYNKFVGAIQPTACLTGDELPTNGRKLEFDPENENPDLTLGRALRACAYGAGEAAVMRVVWDAETGSTHMSCGKVNGLGPDASSEREFEKQSQPPVEKVFRLPRDEERDA